MAGTATCRIVLGLVVALLTTGAAAAPSHSVESDGVTVWATGDDARGQQGNGAAAARQLAPAEVAVVGAVAMASGRDHGYALRADGSLVAWGANEKGQLGDTTLTDRQAPVAVAVPPLTGVEAGHYHGIGLDPAGDVWTWGYGALGQLGRGSTTTSPVPSKVAGTGGAVAVAAGRDNSYAVTDNGRVLAWGDNAFGQVGDGTTLRRLTPVQVPGLSGVVELGVGRNHVLARTTSGALWSWGDNAYGQVGDGTTTSRAVPVRVLAGGVRHVDAGAHHSIAVLDDGKVLTWGRGYRGQLGLGTTSGRTTPTQVADLPPAIEVGDGRDTSFAVTASGEVWAWGDNGAGQLGDGTTAQRTRPVRLPSPDGVVAVQGGALHTLLLRRTAASSPTVDFQASCTGLRCDFTALPAQGGGTAVASTWELGDGSTAVGPTVQHTYAAAGTYRVRLWVSDDRGATAERIRDVTVRPDVATIRHVGATGQVGNAGTASTVLPSGVLPGDQLLLALTTNRAATANDIDGGRAWSLLTSSTATTGDMRTSVWARQSEAGDAGRTVRLTLDAQSKFTLSAAAYRGAAVVASASEAETLNRATHRTPLLTAAPAGHWVVSHWADKSSSTTDWQQPVGTTQRAELVGAGNGRVTSLVSDAGPGAAGQAGGLLATANSESRKATMVTVVLRPSN